MSIKPILFNTEIVRAILDGRKTVTRRKIDVDISNQFDVESDGKTVIAYIDQETGDSYEPTKVCRYQPGDILYVRETWQIIPCIECVQDEYGICNSKKVEYEDRNSITEGCFVFKEDYTCADRMNWRPSIHMPKEAARIFLRVKNVRVERLQEMKNFRDEGIIPSDSCEQCFAVCGECNPDNSPTGCDNEIETFACLWDSKIKKSDLDRYGWNANPWVWVIEFEMCEKQGDWR